MLHIQSGMFTPRLIASDLDGTLLHRDGTLSERTRHTLQRVSAAGIHIVLVTGRPIRRMRHIAHALELAGVAICGNGAVLYDLQRETILQQTMLSAEAARELIAELRARLPDICFAVETGLAIGREPAYSRHHPNRTFEGAVADAVELCAQGASKLIAFHPTLPLDELMAKVRELVAERAVVSHSGSPFLEIAAAGVTKAWALEAHCQAQGIASERVMAFGDMPNDLPMLEWAGHSVAVANAHPSVLDAVDAITGSNDADGVALYLERHVCRDFSAS